MDRAHFDALFEATLEWPNLEELENDGGELGALARSWRLDREAREEERRRLHADAWGKPDNMLVGWPIVCDDSYPGLDPELVFA